MEQTEPSVPPPRSTERQWPLENLRKAEAAYSKRTAASARSRGQEWPLENLRKALKQEKDVRAKKDSPARKQQRADVPPGFPVGRRSAPPLRREEPPFFHEDRPIIQEEPEPLERTPEWLVKLKDGAVHGPLDASILLEWAIQGRLVPGNEVSPDGEKWLPAESVHVLMNYWIAGTFSDSQDASGDVSSEDFDSRVDEIEQKAVAIAGAFTHAEKALAGLESQYDMLRHIGEESTIQK